ncbi:MAG TPA: 3-hydroxybutyryl-CoA dehydrogenase [Acidimicrobiia bacterium]|nr:3-hydroxybutyryl-CoA dehydrogenase [Acidimicrobiia bacterium]HKN91127.1 3-hydroxybutyryl-CoA dehydrogenase [Acidimicrobiia bacterium]
MTIKRVGIVGSGTMGSGIAEVACKNGYEVVLRSRSQQGADKMITGLEKSLGKQVDKGRLAEAERDAALALVRGVSDLEELTECDLVVESVVEDLAVKKELFATLDRICAPHAILATNTSTLPVVDMAVATSRPGQVVGIHFFNPAPMMALVEVVRAITSTDETVEAALAFARSCGKDPIEVRDVAGFVVNALLFPYLNSAVRLLERGVASQEDIDAAMKAGANMPMGPFALIDLVGIDVTVSILDALHAENPDPFLQPAQHLRRMLSAGRLGRKSGQGFYDYTKR